MNTTQSPKQPSASTALKFGTSGVRGLETDLTDVECTRFARAFIRHYITNSKGHPQGSCVIAGDLRRSTPRILKAVAAGIALEGFSVLDAGMVPTPALAFECSERGLPGIMVTGSHIPADRNGIKFYYPWGEILKVDEAPILAQVAMLTSTGKSGEPPKAQDPLKPSAQPEKIPSEARFVARYLSFFGANALKDLKIVFYEHSSAAREIFPEILEKLGAKVTRIQRSSEFIPVDTEALQNVQALANQVSQHQADALVSTDGDGDRPLLLDDRGQVVRGDQIGVLAALALQADSVSTPVSSSTALEATGSFKEIQRCQIGSPFVAAAMENAILRGKSKVIGYEANGGFLLGSKIAGASSNAFLTPLPTRDSVLPVLLLLSTAKKQGRKLSALVATLPPRYTESDLIRPFAVEKSRALVSRLSTGGLPFFNQAWSSRLGAVQKIDETDGVRVTFASNDILHFRPSGNAPEFRIYSEAATEARAREINGWAREWVLGLEAPAG